MSPAGIGEQGAPRRHGEGHQRQRQDVSWKNLGVTVGVFGWPWIVHG